MENKSKRIIVRMDKKLRTQLERYSKRKDDGNVSMTARKAIKKFIEENENIKS